MKQSQSQEDLFELVRENNVEGLKALYEYHAVELKRNALDVEKAFKHGFEENLRDVRNNSLLHIACKKGSESVVEWALSHGADTNLRNCTGDTPLIFLVNLANDHGNTALHYACFWRRKDLASLLVENGALLNVKNKYGKVPLDKAMLFKGELEDISIKHGVSVLAIHAKVRETKDSDDMAKLRFLHALEQDLEIPFKAMTVMKPAFYSLRAEVMMGSWNFKQVVVKRATWQAFTNEQVLLFKQEAAIIKKHLHINVLPLLGICSVAPNISIITDFMSNGNLYDFLRDPTVLMDVAEAMRLALDVCSGLLFLHTRIPPLYHLNLKTRNILLDENYSVKLSEYGFTSHTFNYISAWFNKKEEKFTFEPECVAPEIFIKRELTSADYLALDIYALGMVLFEIVCREDPFPQMEVEEFVKKLLDTELTPTMPEYVPDELAQTMRSCWNRDPKYRPPLAQIISSLQTFAS
ncbi:kinase-like domain-containing protein [Chytridium lagenaria]|nr:kinase-like domain-containing protein [Chytridium lagenaria]